jgi:hypothetical protein
MEKEGKNEKEMKNNIKEEQNETVRKHKILTLC